MKKKSNIVLELDGIPESKRDEVMQSLRCTIHLFDELLDVTIATEVYMRLYKHVRWLRFLSDKIADISTSTADWDEWAKIRKEKNRKISEELLKECGV